jgi:YfiH family protein
MPPDAWIRPEWAVPPGVHALMSTRRGGPGIAPFDSFNLARNPGDPAVDANRRAWAAALGAEPVWLNQVHGDAVVVLERLPAGTVASADASVTATPGRACCVMVADCLPVLFCSDDGRAVGAAHAGWRGLAAGVLERTLDALCDLAGCPPSQVQTWLGPCIGPRRFEVGADVLQVFDADPQSPSPLFVRRDRPDGQARWLADLPGLARQRLRHAGVQRCSGGRWCTVEDASAFFSFRRDGASGPTGRMAAGITITR